jgi:hypothetical protein
MDTVARKPRLSDETIELYFKDINLVPDPMGLRMPALRDLQEARNELEKAAKMLSGLYLFDKADFKDLAKRLDKKYGYKIWVKR